MVARLPSGSPLPPPGTWHETRSPAERRKSSAGEPLLSSSRGDFPTRVTRSPTQATRSTRTTRTASRTRASSAEVGSVLVWFALALATLAVLLSTWQPLAKRSASAALERIAASPADEGSAAANHSPRAMQTPGSEDTRLAAVGLIETPRQNSGRQEEAHDRPTGEGGRDDGDVDAVPIEGEDARLLQLFAEALGEIESSYVEPVDRRELIEAAIEGMLSRLDQHSDYISPDELRRLRGSIENQYGGIGVQVSIENDRLQVISPYFGSPAYQQGILAGDTILAIEGESTEGMSLDRAVELTTGQIGTPVRLTIRHGHDETVEEVVLKRAIIKLETVLGAYRTDEDRWSYTLTDQPRLGYVRLTGFGRTTAAELYRVVAELQADGARGLILDLRFNPGGLLSSAIQISDFFLREGTIVSVQGRDRQPQSWQARDGRELADLPLVILVNRYSASASEIVSACLQDNGRAVIIGERTFGKGSVQNVIPLEGGTRALKLTTAGYLRPNGKNIHRREDAAPEDEWGVTPNSGFAIEMSEAELTGYLLARRELDVIGTSDEELEQSAGEANPLGTPRGVGVRPPRPPQQAAGDQAEPASSPAAQRREVRPLNLPAEDRPLQRAIEYLNDQLEEPSVAGEEPR